MLKKLLLVLTGLLLLGGCGSTATQDGLPASYIGSTSPAMITMSNAKRLADGAMNGVQMGSPVDVVAKPAATGNDKTISLLQRIAVIAQEAGAATAEVTEPAKRLASTATTYGYSGDYTISGTPGSSSATITYHHYQQTSTAPTLDGTFSFSGVSGPGGTTFSLSMSTSSATYTDSSNSYTISGTFAMNSDGSTTTLTANLAITDNIALRTTVAKDYTLQFTGTSLSFTGTYYDPIYGYVTIATATPLTAASISADPTAGRILLSGAFGTKARLTFNATGYGLEADTAGNGAFVTVP
ncbi:hypothetical protein [Geomesophilobacter sediminis]|uniref:Lipoprotein n=1 Tax=Geomesophilobacter sediminis TaxID=2798584 RepID=A0A8J7M352_9BACT|nr:hypothetical protein [Geomesophilobacter sediminis]MBJ6727787.1 hypothetical protein [Geomesophilobacter sediminis]